MIITKDDKMVKVRDLEIGEAIKFNNTVAYVVEVKSDRVMLNKNKNGFGMFSESFSSSNYDDLENRVERA